MKITRQRLKNIIMEEIALQEATPAQVELDPQSGNAPANQKGMAELGEGLDMITPENIELAANVLAQMTKNFAAPVTAAIGSMSFIDAVKYLAGMQKAAPQEPETVQEEAEEGTLESLITQAIQEELAQLASKNVK